MPSPTLGLWWALPWGTCHHSWGTDQYGFHEGSKAWTRCEALGPAGAQVRDWGIA